MCQLALSHPQNFHYHCLNLINFVWNHMYLTFKLAVPLTAELISSCYWQPLWLLSWELKHNLLLSPEKTLSHYIKASINNKMLFFLGINKQYQTRPVMMYDQCQAAINTCLMTAQKRTFWHMQCYKLLNFDFIYLSCTKMWRVSQTQLFYIYKHWVPSAAAVTRKQKRQSVG
jgi:hypothetical protein